MFVKLMEAIHLHLIVVLALFTAACAKNVPRKVELTSLEKFAIDVVNRTVYVRDCKTQLLFVVSDITLPMSHDRRYAVNVINFHRFVELPECKIINLE